MVAKDLRPVLAAHQIHMIDPQIDRKWRRDRVLVLALPLDDLRAPTSQAIGCVEKGLAVSERQIKMRPVVPGTPRLDDRSPLIVANSHDLAWNIGQASVKGVNACHAQCGNEFGNQRRQTRHGARPLWSGGRPSCHVRSRCFVC